MGFYNKNEKAAQYHIAILIMKVVKISPTPHGKGPSRNSPCEF